MAPDPYRDPRVHELYWILARRQNIAQYCFSSDGSLSQNLGRKGGWKSSDNDRFHETSHSWKKRLNISAQRKYGGRTKNGASLGHIQKGLNPIKLATHWILALRLFHFAAPTCRRPGESAYRSGRPWTAKEKFIGLAAAIGYRPTDGNPVQ